MPNWCINRAAITGPKPVITELKQVLARNDPELLAWMVPQPRFEGDQEWYAWNVSNWGTKWDVTDVTMLDDTKDDSVTVEFSTAWSPPVEAFSTWAQSTEGVKFRLDYWEGGMGYVGNTTYDGEYLDTDDVDSQTDPDRYRDLARDVWGYTEWEEPEPLTEWYKEGIKEKGLTNGI